MSEPIVFLNGEFLPASQAKLNIYDLGVVMGATFSEMTRTFRHQLFRAEDHVNRLYRSAKYGGIALPLTAAEMLAKTHELARANCALIGEAVDLAVVHFITPGENRIYAGGAASATPLAATPLSPTVCIHSFPLAFAAWRHLFRDGAHVVTPAIRHIPPQCIDPKTKNRSRLHWHLADQQARAVDPQAISLLLDLDGNITECAGANFLVIKDRTIYSPTSRNILQGISLLTARDLAASLDLQWIEKDLQPYDVINADEAWLTTTPYCVAPATRINGIPIGSGQPGPLWRVMLKAWSDLAGLDIEAQILCG